MAVEILMPKKYGKTDSLKHALAPGRPKGKPIGTFLSDLIVLRKIILLCRGCESKFDYWRHAYRREDMLCDAVCDACRADIGNDADKRAFIPEENWHVAHSGDTSKPRKGRWGLPPHHIVNRIRFPTRTEVTKALFGRG